MDFPTTLSDALVALEAAQKDVAALNALTEEHTATLNQLQELNVLLQQQTQDLLHERLEKTKLIEENDVLRRKEIDALAKADVVMANLGVPPVEIQPEQSFHSRSVDELWKEYNSLPISERNAFYLKHKAALSFR